MRLANPVFGAAVNLKVEFATAIRLASGVRNVGGGFNVNTNATAYLPKRIRKPDKIRLARAMWFAGFRHEGAIPCVGEAGVADVT
jgi:hypothetical protein